MSPRVTGCCCILAALAGCVSPIPFEIESKYAVADPQFACTMGNLFGPPLVGGNRITTLVNGDEIFPAMLGAIRGAEKTITLESYIYGGGIGAEFTDALTERAAAGVKVHVVIDAIGGGDGLSKLIGQMREAGVEVHEYHKLRWWEVRSHARVNFRTHRKLMVVDGKIGFIGGVCIDDPWLGDAQGPGFVRDNHYKVEGPVVAQLQAAFIDNWLEVSGRVIHCEDYFPPPDPVGEVTAQVFKSSTGNNDQSLHLTYLLSLAAARERVCLGTPYFVPDEHTLTLLVRTAKRGVKVQVILPGRHTDSNLSRQAARTDYGDLLKAGVEIYEYQPTMYHTKLMVVDGLWCSVGSANLDHRSFLLNDEANLNVLDAAFAAEQLALFEEDLRHCKRITYEQWSNRSIIKKACDGFASLFDRLL